MMFENLPSSADLARKVGSPSYFTGKPCRRGHLSWRYTRNSTCYQCQYEQTSVTTDRRGSRIALKGPQLTVDTPKIKSAKALIDAAMRRARCKGLCFNLTLDFVLSIFPDRCPILDIELSYVNSRTNRDTSPSIDRIDNTKGYTQDNVVVVSFRANRIKNDSSMDELKKVYDYYTNR